MRDGWATFTFENWAEKFRGVSVDESGTVTISKKEAESFLEELHRDSKGSASAIEGLIQERNEARDTLDSHVHENLIKVYGDCVQEYWNRRHKDTDAGTLDGISSEEEALFREKWNKPLADLKKLLGPTLAEEVGNAYDYIGDCERGCGEDDGGYDDQAHPGGDSDYPAWKEDYFDFLRNENS